jgi:hypothetical protein
VLPHQDALVTTPLGVLPDWSWKPCWSWKLDPLPDDVLEPLELDVLDPFDALEPFDVPDPSAGSCPCAICVASPPAITPDAASDTAITRTLAVRVEILGVRSMLMTESLAATSQASLRAALALYKNPRAPQGSIRNRSARADPPWASICTRSAATGSKAPSRV